MRGDLVANGVPFGGVVRASMSCRDKAWAVS